MKKIRSLIDQIDATLADKGDVEDLATELGFWSNLLDPVSQAEAKKMMAIILQESIEPQSKTDYAYQGKDADSVHIHHNATPATDKKLCIGPDEYSLVPMQNSPSTFRVEGLAMLDAYKSIDRHAGTWRVVIGEKKHEIEISKMSAPEQPERSKAVHRLAASSRPQGAADGGFTTLAEYASQAFSFVVQANEACDVFIRLKTGI